MYWLLIGIVVLVMILLVWTNSAKTLEHFATVDLDTATAQRQQLQFEGERRYNELGRLQTAGLTLPTDLVDATITQPLAKPSKDAASLLTLVGSSLGLGAGAGPSRGVGVEQTGAVMEKIKFCESLPLDCSKLDDPRMAECGFCHRDGVDSKGKPHRGGMYISADSIIRANEAAEGGTAHYQPSVGKCKPQNFTLMKDNCAIREQQLACLSAGAATSANQCGQCYGASPGGASGLIFMGPKPRVFTAVLVLSHPGMHNYQGTGTIVTMPDGSTINVPYSDNHLLAPTTVYLNNVKEGDNIGIKVFGIPMVWCAWLTSTDGNRSVGIDIGLQNESANLGIVIAGDKRSAPVAKAIGSYDGDTWATFQNQVPNTVMWYARRDEILGGGITSAFYGDANKNGIWVGRTLKGLAGAYVDIPVNTTTFGSDPSPGNPKNLNIWLDNGQSFNVADGTTIPKGRLNNSVNLQVTIPATLTDPAFPDDKADCPTGPIVTTAVGAGLMGSHSCFKPDGSFNPTSYCLQELFMAAGGTNSGTDYPSTDAKAAALVVNNSLDDTVARLNNLASIALYGVTTAGSTVSFDQIKDASMRMLGKSPSNPCDGPNAATGPQTAECLDYLWRTAGAVSLPPAGTEPESLGYQYCGKGAPGAPLRADGSVNDANMSAANALGSVTAIRQAYKTLYQRTQNSANFQDQNAAMEQCFGVAAKPPPPKPFTCVPEVFNICPNGGYTLSPDEAAATCEAAGARLATPQEIADAQKLGANWCACGWASDGIAYYPMNKILPEYGGGCGSVGVNSCGNVPWGGGKACATCFGVKPKAETNPPGVLSFNSDYQSSVSYNMTSPGYDEGSGMGQTCFDGLTVAQAQAQCTANPNCKSFSFAAGQVGVPMDVGGGCFKMDHVGFNPNPAYVGFTKVDTTKLSATTWNAPQIPQIGQLMSATSAAATGTILRHSNFQLWINPPDGMTSQDGTFKVVAANNGKSGYVSFQSVNYPDHYIRHSNFRGLLNSNDGGASFGDDSSFAVVPALNGKSTMYSLQSYNFPDHYLMTKPGTNEVWLMVPGAASDAASWGPIPPQNGTLNIA